MKTSPFLLFAKFVRPHIMLIGVLIFVTGALIWNTLQEAHLRTLATEAVNRGVGYLDQKQGPSGEFPTYMWTAKDPAALTEMGTPFTASQLLHSLTFVDGGEIGHRIKARAMGYLLAEQDPPSLWRFLGKGRRDLFSPDADDTVQAWAALFEQGIPVDPHVIEILKTFRTESGLFLTWLDLPESFRGVDSVEIDMIVNLNTLFLFSLLGQSVPEVCREVIAHTKTGAFQKGTVYYLSPLAYTYFLSRAYTDGHASCLGQAVPDIRSYVLSHQQADGSWGTALETALGVLTLLNIGERGASMRQGIIALLACQQPGGAWKRAPLYNSANRMAYWGSRSLTTGFCLEALGKYLAQR